MTITGSTGKTYQIHQAKDGAWVCSCAAWKFSHRPANARACKHLNALALSLAAHLEKAAAA